MLRKSLWRDTQVFFCYTVAKMFWAVKSHHEIKFILWNIAVFILNYLSVHTIIYLINVPL